MKYIKGIFYISSKQVMIYLYTVMKNFFISNVSNRKLKICFSNKK
jgi:hypothetical protein